VAGLRGSLPIGRGASLRSFAIGVERSGDSGGNSGVAVIRWGSASNGQAAGNVVDPRGESKVGAVGVAVETASRLESGTSFTLPAGIVGICVETNGAANKLGDCDGTAGDCTNCLMAVGSPKKAATVNPVAMSAVAMNSFRKADTE
jgi:hypothetical protein